VKILLLDIKTSPNKVYTWGLFRQNIAINQIVEPGYTLSWAAKWHGEKKVYFNSLNKSSEEEMLQEIWELINEADVVVHYNGKKFDIPTLNKEFILHGMDLPDSFHQIDVLETIRKRFRFTSNKLDFVAQSLGLGAKTSHKGMELWRDCMDGVQSAWKIMEKYNRNDVILLEKLYNKVLPWIQNHPNHALYTDEERPICTNCGSHKVVKKGTETTLTQIYQRYKCTNCGTPLRGRFTLVDKDKKKTILTQSKL